MHNLMFISKFKDVEVNRLPFSIQWKLMLMLFNRITHLVNGETGSTGTGHVGRFLAADAGHDAAHLLPAVAGAALGLRHDVRLLPLLRRSSRWTAGPTGLQGEATPPVDHAHFFLYFSFYGPKSWCLIWRFLVRPFDFECNALYDSIDHIVCSWWTKKSEHNGNQLPCTFIFTSIPFWGRLDGWNLSNLHIPNKIFQRRCKFLVSVYKGLVIAHSVGHFIVLQLNATLLSSFTWLTEP